MQMLLKETDYLRRDRNIRKSYFYGKISGKSVVIGPLYYILGECKEGLHFHFDEIKACFDKAIYFLRPMID